MMIAEKYDPHHNAFWITIPGLRPQRFAYGHLVWLSGRRYSNGSRRLAHQERDHAGKRNVRRIGAKDAKIMNITGKPLADHGLISYRYRGRYGWIMIGAKDDTDAQNEARRSTDDAVTADKLEIWNGTNYVPVRT